MYRLKKVYVKMRRSVPLTYAYLSETLFAKLPNQNSIRDYIYIFKNLIPICYMFLEMLKQCCHLISDLVSRIDDGAVRTCIGAELFLRHAHVHEMLQLNSFRN